MKKILGVLALLFGLTLLALPVNAALVDTIIGRIILQVERNGEAWYVNPETRQIHFLGRPIDALLLLQEIGLGISNADLAKLKGEGADTKGLDPALSAKLSGKILLQVEANGEAWYIWPENNERYYLGTPEDALRIFRQLGLGIAEVHFVQLSPDIDYQSSREVLDLVKIAIVDIEDRDVQQALFDGRIKHLTSSDTEAIKFELTSPLSTDDHGYLGKGYYYYVNGKWLMNQSEYQNSTFYVGLEGKTISEQIAAQMLAIQSSLEVYQLAVGGYPLSQGQDVIIGINDRKILSKERGFFGKSSDENIFHLLDLPPVKDHSYIYSDLDDGLSYQLTFEIPLSIEGFPEGEYQLTPNGIFEIVNCITLFAPVCGVDGVTYSNECVAISQHHVEIDHDGECEV